MSAQEIDKNAWLQELLDQRIALKRQLFSADSQSATISGGSGSKSFTSRSVADIKEKIDRMHRNNMFKLQLVETFKPF